MAELINENMDLDSVFEESFSNDGNGGRFQQQNGLSCRRSLNSYGSTYEEPQGSKITEDRSIMRNVRQIKKREGLSASILSGTIELVVQWNRSPLSVSHPHILYETIGLYVSNFDDDSSHHQILLLRQPRGPVMKVMVYRTPQPALPECYPGKYLCVIGKFTKDNTLKAHRVTEATESDYATLQRIAHICSRRVRHLLNTSE